jgi:DNA repair exonuclease SbcCD ATPase subunit
LRIIELRAENFKRLTAVNIAPSGDVVVVSGKNAQGKSSVLDAIWMALGGKDAAKGTTKPVREGAASAKVSLHLGELIVTRTWSKAGGNLKVTLANGQAVSSPQTVLDKLIGKLTFDPLAFANADAKTQVKQLLEVVDLPFNPEELEAERRDVFDSRTLTGREVKRLRGHLDTLPQPDPKAPDQPVSASELSIKLQEAEALERRRTEMRKEFYEVRDAIKVMEEDLARYKVRFEELRKAGMALPEPVDIEELRKELVSVDEINAQVRHKQEYSRAVDALEEVEQEYASQTDRLKELEAIKTEAIAKADMPLPGLSFDETGVLYQGVPFSQASAAEKLRVSTAMAMALNPEVRVIRILDGSLLDSDNLKVIEDLAKEKDFQVWIEKVDETGEVGFVIEDGKVVSS